MIDKHIQNKKNMKIIKNQKGFGAIELILIIVVLGIIGGIGYYVVNKNKDVPTDSSEQPSQSVNKDEFFNEVEKKLKAQSFDGLSKIEILQKDDDNSGFILLNEDGYATTIDSQVISLKFSGAHPCGDDDLGCESFNYEEKLPQIKEVDKVIGALAQKHSLMSDNVNAKKDTTIDLNTFGGNTGNYSAYKNNEFICSLGEPNAEYGTPDLPSNTAKYSLSFGCVDNGEYENQHKLQKELIDAYFSDPELSAYKDLKNFSVYIEKIKGDFILGNVPGAYAVWKKTSSGWTYLFGGQDSPSCSQADGQGIPEDLLPSNECYDGDKARQIR